MFGFKKKSKETSKETKPDLAVETPIKNVESGPVRDDEKTVQVDYMQENAKKYLAGAQHIGTRKVQQDACYVSGVSDPYVYGVLCDGMGGMEDGEKISADVVIYFADYLTGILEEEQIPVLLQSGVDTINERMLKSYADSKAGTTLSIALIWENRLYWASVGDSRIYIIRGEEIARLTRDHNYGLELEDKVKAGVITKEEAASDPQREALISYIGNHYLNVIDLSLKPLVLEEGDCILLCSDGLTKSLSDKQILDYVCEYREDAEECARMLTLLAFDEGSGSKDNTTVIFMHYPYHNGNA